MPVLGYQDIVFTILLYSAGRNLQIDGDQYRLGKALRLGLLSDVGLFIGE